jgi:hypothetical protein
VQTSKGNQRRHRRPARAGRNSRPSEKMQASFKTSLPSLSRRSLKLSLIALAALVLILAGTVWFYKTYSSPKNVFWGMVSNNLSTAGVTRLTDQTTCLPVNAQMSNVIQINFQPKLQVHCVTKVANGNTFLTIESIGNRTADYQHYLQILQPGTPQSKLNDIYGLWLKNNGDPNAEAKLYTLVLNDPALFGSLTSPQKQSLIVLLHKAYNPNLKKAVKQKNGGRSVYVYQVDLGFRKYAEAEKLYAQYLHLPIAGRINPANYAPTNRVSLTFTVDVLSRQLKEVRTQSLREQYSGYGIQNPAQLPAKLSTNADLQKAFQKL